MRAVVISRPGSPDVLELAERPAPKPAAHEVLIRVAAAGLNRADLAQREGKYPPPPGVAADIPGLEIAGVVTECGAAVTRWKPGDRVCALLAGGGYSEMAAVDARHCLPIPEGWSATDAAALPEALFTVWSNVFQRGRLTKGETLLVHGGSSGIGMATLQLAREAGATAFATAGSAEKCAACVAAGATRAINYRTEDFEEVLRDQGVDVILDMVGGDYTAKNLRLLRPEGRLVWINAMNGAKAEINALQIMQRRLTLTGSTLRSREPEFKAVVAAELERTVWPLLAASRFKAHVHRVFPFTAAADAHRLMHSSEHIGKIVLAW
jgi:putative PIG3 family NAD(P)H quinone oxidoreductase